MSMESEIVQAVADYAESVLGQEGFRYISAVVATCKMLALQLEGEDEEASQLHMEALVLSAYLHNISTIEFGFQDHHVKSAEMAVEFLQKHEAAEELVCKVKEILLAHTTVLPAEERATLPLEARIVYDADKLGRLSGLAVVTSLIEFGARYPNRAVNGEVLSAILRHIEERFVELFQSLHTAPAREMAREKFGNTLAFLDGVIEHLSDATPI
ncbi:MAG TPA: HD domain-containing protein [Ktedonobacteraceae bacterium]|nr:HD domain-containing protein [Ktedonobacteraceae bacterium]